MRPRYIAAILALVAAAVATIAQGPLRMRVYATGFTDPVALVQDPSDRAVQFVVEQAGRIRVVRSGTVLPQGFLDLRTVVLAGVNADCWAWRSRRTPERTVLRQLYGSIG
jgi:hypothetical protein